MKQWIHHVSESAKRIVLLLTPFLVYYVAVLLLLTFSSTPFFSGLNEDEVQACIVRKILQEHCGSKTLADLFIKTGRLYDVDPYLLYGISKASSGLDTEKVVVSNNGTEFLGLMQLDAFEFSRYSKKSLLDPEINLKLGAWKLQQAMKSGGQMIKTLAVYHTSSKPVQNGRYGQATLDYIEKVLKEYSGIQRSAELYMQENYDLLFAENES